MDSERFDALSRLLATPMPRRRGLQLFATAVAGVLGFNGAKVALAGQPCPPPSPVPGGVPNGCPCIGATDCKSGACCNGFCCKPPSPNCRPLGRSCKNDNQCCVGTCLQGGCACNEPAGQLTCIPLQTCVNCSCANCTGGCRLDGACTCVCCQAPKVFSGGLLRLSGGSATLWEWLCPSLPRWANPRPEHLPVRMSSG